MNINSKYTGQRELAVKICFYLILAIGLYLRFYQFLMGRSLWEDEGHVSLNFIYRGYKDLMLPLDNYQTAPIFFLWSVETMSRLFGFGEKALRSFTFLISIVSLPFFYFFVRDLTKSRLTALIAFFIFSLNVSFIYYSSEIKSYGVDVCFYVFIGYLLLSEHDFVKKYRPVLLSLVGCLALGYSNVSIVVLFCGGLYLLSQWTLQREKDNFNVGIPKNDVLIFCSWFVVFVVNYFLFIYKHPYGEGMKSIWKDSFPPVNIFSPEFSNFIRARIGDTIFWDMLFFTEDFYFRYALSALLIVALGYIIYTKRYSILTFTVVPIIVQLAISMLQMYPFFFRFILYLLPGFIILTSIGIAVLTKFIAKKIHLVLATPLVAFCCYCCVIISIQKFPKWDLEIKPAIDFINKNYPDKKIIVTHPFTLYLYYMETGYVKNRKITFISWDLKPSDYYTNDVIKTLDSNYILFHSHEGVLKDLKEKGLIVRQFQYKTYVVSEVRPLSITNSTAVTN